MTMIVPIATMTAAVTFYTLGVFSEKKEGKLTKNHVAIFWLGLFFDTTGTTAMGMISDGFTLNIHGITGLAALILMALHVLWATMVLFKGSEKQKTGFHRFSVWVWIIWLVPFFSGMALNMK